MTYDSRHISRSRGSSLVEAVIAIGVLAVVAPLVFGALAESGKSSFAAEAETRSAWMIPVCMNEILASREGRPRYFAATSAGQAFPPDGEVWALAFSPEGEPVGKLTKALYERGTKVLDDRHVRYIALLSASPETVSPGATPSMRVRISLEYPAASPAAKRRKLDSYTRIP